MTHRPSDEESTRTIVRDLASASRAALSRQTQPETPGVGPLCSVHQDDVVWIKERLSEIVDQLAKENTRTSLLEHRIGFLEKIVFTACGLILVAVLVGLIALVVRSGPTPSVAAAAKL